MKILSHRGYWRNSEEKNKGVAFERSFSHGYGTETDFRDLYQNLKIAHDPAKASDLDAESMMSIWQHYQSKRLDLPLALNIKADGLQSLTRELLDTYECENYFVFDMSVPDTLHWVNQGFNVFVRQSEYEPEPCLYEQAAGVWLDPMLHDDWVTDEMLLKHIDAGKEICIVSPDLHKREHVPFWEKILNWQSVGSDQLMVCTDYPGELEVLKNS